MSSGSANGKARVVISSFDSPANPHYNGGGATVIEMIAGKLASRFHVTVVTVGPRSDLACRPGVDYRNLPIGWAGPRGGQLLYHVLVPFAAWRIKHDLWIENFTPPFTTGFLPLFSRSKVIGFAQSLSGEEMSARYRLPFYRIERFGLRFYRDVIVLNAADAARVQGCNKRASVYLIPNGIKYRDLNAAQLGQGEYILYLGRIDIRKKGLDLLLQAYKRSGVALPLIIAGAGTPGEERKFTAMIEAADANARWIGFVAGQSKEDLLEHCAFVVVPSRYETFGLSALEGMLFGKPVVHFDIPTLRWIDGDVRVPPFDVSSFARQLRDLAGDEQARRRLGGTAYAAALRFEHEETSDRYLALVDQLLAPEPETGLADSEAGMRSG